MDLYSCVINVQPLFNTAVFKSRIIFFHVFILFFFFQCVCSIEQIKSKRFGKKAYGAFIGILELD